MDRLSEVLNRCAVVLGDGAMGTMLQLAGLPANGLAEEWNVSHPEAIRAIHQGYVDAGSQVIESNSFGGNRVRLAMHGVADQAALYNFAAARLAREVAGSRVLVAGSVGPTGALMVPFGDCTPIDARNAFAEQARSLEEGGVDFFLVETMSALDEVQAAIEGIRSESELPIAVTMTFQARHHTMMGVSPDDALNSLYRLGIRYIGSNCGNGPAETEQVMAAMAAVRPPDVHLLVQSNAGLPRWANNRTTYDGTPQVMADYATRMKALGVRYIGACCGSTPDHIRAMRRALDETN